MKSTDLVKIESKVKQKDVINANDITSEIAKIKSEAARFEKLEQELKELRELKNKRFIKKEQKELIKTRINTIRNELGIKKDSIKYTVGDIRNAKPKEMLIDKLLARGSITIFTGKTGTGKSTLVKHIYKTLLKSNPNVYIRYLDFDNPTENLKDFQIDKIQEKYGERFEYYGKRDPEKDLDMIDEAESVISDIIDEQLAHSNRIYIIIEDNLKNIARKNKKGFIDPLHLWKLEKRFQAAGGTTIPLHHTNKAGVYADTADIMNFVDIAFTVSYNQNSGSIIVEPDKQSRFKVEPKAFKVDPATREIVQEIEYKIANTSQEEIKIVNTIKDLLIECGDFNQSELEKEVRPLRIALGMGEKKFRAILKKHAGTAWTTVRGENNALIFSLIATKPGVDKEVSSLKNLPNLPNSDFKGIIPTKPKTEQTSTQQKMFISDGIQENMNDIPEV